MKMKLYIPFLLAGTALGIGIAPQRNDHATNLTILKEQFNEAKQEAITELSDRYIRRMERLKLKYLEIGNKKKATEVDQEIKHLTGEILRAKLINKTLKYTDPSENWTQDMIFHPDGKLQFVQLKMTGKWMIKEGLLRIELDKNWSEFSGETIMLKNKPVLERTKSEKGGGKGAFLMLTR